MGEMLGGSRLLGMGLAAVLAIMALSLGVLALVKYLSKRK